MKHLIKDHREPGEYWFECLHCGKKTDSYFVGRTDGRFDLSPSIEKDSDAIYAAFAAEDCEE